MSSDHDLFDDLARHKLEERSFAYDEAHWEAAQYLLRKQRRRKGVWFWLPLSLLSVAGLGWWLMQEPRVTETVATSQVDPTVQHQTAHAATAPVEPVTPATTATMVEQVADATMDAERIQPEQTAPTPRATAPRDRTVDDNIPVRMEHHAVEGNEAHQTAQIGMTTPEEVPTSAIDLAVLPDAGRKDEPIPSDGNTETRILSSGTAASVAVMNVPNAITPAAPSLPDATEPSTHAEEEVIVQTEPTLADSSATAATTPQIEPLPKRWQWEASLLGGALLSTSRYSGGNSADWSPAIEGALAPAWGGELAMTQKHFGFGLGLHYITYSELLRADQVSEQFMSTSTSYSLNPINVTVLAVVDTVFQGGNYYYVTVPIDTVIQQLVIDTDTSYTTQVRRAAMDEVNVVSYLEVPLFVDVHGACGRWSFGMRGGPLLGFLTGQRTTLPNADFSNTLDLQDETFRGTVFGWTARAYMRYRLTNSLSLGLEPMLRGHFGDDLDGAAYQRRSSGYGGLFSVNWRW